MKILHLDTGKEWRGGQRQAKILHEGLLASGIESFFLANHRGILYKELNNTNKLPLEYRGEFSYKTHQQVAEIIKSINPDIIHAHDGHSVTLGAWHKMEGKKFIATRRVSYPISFLSRHLKYSRVDYHVAVSHDIAKYLARYFNKITVIHSCIQNSRFHRNINESPLEKSSTINILFVGAFSPQKGIDILIKAFADIYKTHKNSTLHLVGDGKLLSEIKQLSEDLDIHSQIVFYGARIDIENFYLNSDIVVVPSIDGEGSSGVIKEGMAAGKIVIASSLDANKELLDDGKNGILFQCGSYSDLVLKLKYALANPSVIDKANILNKANSFDCKLLIKDYTTLYEKILS